MICGEIIRLVKLLPLLLLGVIISIMPAVYGVGRGLTCHNGEHQRNYFDLYIKTQKTAARVGEKNEE